MMTHLRVLQLLLLSIAPLTTHGFGRNLIKVPEEDHSKVACSIALLRKYFRSGEALSGAVLSMSLTTSTLHVQQRLLHALHTDPDMAWSVVVKNSRRPLHSTIPMMILHEKPQCYFVVVENLEDDDLEDIFEDWKTNVNWNPLAQFVVYLASVEETDEEMTELMVEILLSFMNKKIFNVNVIGQNEENGLYYGKTVFPYHPDNNCGNRVIAIETIDICDYQDGERRGDKDEGSDDNYDDGDEYEEIEDGDDVEAGIKNETKNKGQDDEDINEEGAENDEIEGRDDGDGKIDGDGLIESGQKSENNDNKDYQSGEGNTETDENDFSKNNAGDEGTNGNDKNHENSSTNNNEGDENIEENNENGRNGFTKNNGEDENNKGKNDSEKNSSTKNNGKIYEGNTKNDKIDSSINNGGEENKEGKSENHEDDSSKNNGSDENNEETHKIDENGSTQNNGSDGNDESLENSSINNNGVDENNKGKEENVSTKNNGGDENNEGKNENHFSSNNGGAEKYEGSEEGSNDDEGNDKNPISERIGDENYPSFRNADNYRKDNRRSIEEVGNDKSNTYIKNDKNGEVEESKVDGYEETFRYKKGDTYINDELNGEVRDGRDDDNSNNCIHNNKNGKIDENDENNRNDNDMENDGNDRNKQSIVNDSNQGGRAGGNDLRFEYKSTQYNIDDGNHEAKEDNHENRGISNESESNIVRESAIDAEIGTNNENGEGNLDKNKRNISNSSPLISYTKVNTERSHRARHEHVTLNADTNDCNKKYKTNRNKDDAVVVGADKYYENTSGIYVDQNSNHSRNHKRHCSANVRNQKEFAQLNIAPGETVEPDGRSHTGEVKVVLKELYRALFLDKFPKDLSGCPVMAAYRPWEPYIFAEISDDTKIADFGDDLMGDDGKADGANTKNVDVETEDVTGDVDSDADITYARLQDYSNKNTSYTITDSDGEGDGGFDGDGDDGGVGVVDSDGAGDGEGDGPGDDGGDVDGNTFTEDSVNEEGNLDNESDTEPGGSSYGDAGLEDGNTNPETHLSGIEYKMVQTIGELLHINIDLQVESSNLYHLFQQLIDGDIEMLFGGIDEDPSISQFVSSTIPYHQDDLTWCVAKAKRDYSLFNFLESFHIYAWILIICFVLVMSINILIGQKLLKFRVPYFSGFISATIRLFGILLAQSTKLDDIPTSMKLFFSSAFLMGFMFVNFYQSFLISTLTTPQSAHQISQLAELHQQRMTVTGSVENVRHLNKDGEVFKYIREKFEMCYNIEECLSEAASDEHIAVAVSRQHSFYNPRIQRDQLYCFGRDENLYMYLVTMLLPKKFHLLHKINPVIQHIIESGHMQKWARDLDLKRKLREQILHARQELVQRLTLKQVGGSFILHIILVTLALLVFVLERATYWLVVKRRTRLKAFRLLHRHLRS